MTQYKVPVFNSSGQLTDEAHRPLATVEYVDAEISSAITDPNVDVDDLPPNSILVVKKSGVTWPGPPTLRSDIILIWKGADPSPPPVSVRTLGTPGMLDNVDLRIIT
jgi:hypothetical protein